MAITGIASSGLISGLNVSDLVSKILHIEERPIRLLKLRQNDYDLKIASIISLKSRLASYKSSLTKLNDKAMFNTKSASISKTSGGVDLLKVSADGDAIAGSYSINVNQLAKANKLASEGVVDKTSTAIASATGSFTFKVGGYGAETSVGVTSTTTLQELADAINTKNADVTASIIDDGTGSNEYRLILTANDTGAANYISITANGTSLDFTNKQIEAAYAYTDNTYSGTVASNSGTNASSFASTTNKTYMVEAVSAGASGVAAYKYSIDGGINWLGYNGVAYNSSAGNDTDGGGITTTTDYTSGPEYIDGTAAANANNGAVQIQFSAGSDLAVGDNFTVDVFNPEMQEAKDAVIEVDNATMVKSSNNITDAVPGITLDLLKADTTETLTLTVTASSTTAQKDIESFVESYNSLFDFIEEQLSYDPDDPDTVPNPLLGDPTLLEIKRRITNTISNTIPGLSTASYTNMSQIGITTDYKTGRLELDDLVLRSALSQKPDDVAKLFIGTGTPSNSAVTYVGKTADTQAGKYSLSISTAPEKATITSDNAMSSTSLASEEVLIFKYSSNYTDTDATTTAINVTLAAGSTINTIVTTINSAFATNDLALTASKTTDGKLKIESDTYGKDIWMQVNTNQGNATTQLWDASGSYSDDGVDIAGTINAHVAVGDGNVLKATAGFVEEGLEISTTSTQTGGFGTIAVSLGIADKLPAVLQSYVSSENGILKTKETGMQDSIDDIELSIERMTKRIQEKERRLLAEFSRLEVLLAKYDALAQYLTNNLMALPTIKR